MNHTASPHTEVAARLSALAELADKKKDIVPISSWANEELIECVVKSVTFHSTTSLTAEDRAFADRQASKEFGMP